MLMIIMIDRACSIVNKTCFSHIYKVHNITVTRNLGEGKYLSLTNWLI